jgi:succinoglycan biosynthesis protein ExoL
VSEPHHDQGGASVSSLHIAYFAPDAADSAVRKRIRAFEAHGAQVLGLTFARARAGPDYQPYWRNVELGVTQHRNYLARIPKLLLAVLKACRRRSGLELCAVYYARNIDMLFVAAATRWLLRSKASLVYEVLDVQRVFLGQGAINQIFRWLERQLLKRSDLLVVSSPEFVSRYFEPMQGYAGSWYLLENKVAAGQIPHSARHGHLKAGPPWVIGWFGALRCRRSLEALAAIADALGDRVQIHLRGWVSPTDIPRDTFENVVGARSNLTYFGPYLNPANLAEIYHQVHFSWCIDYLDAGANSDWLLPNRVYEGGLFGVVALARSETATGRFVAAAGLGKDFGEPLTSSLVNYLESLDPETYERTRRIVVQTPSSVFVDEDDTSKLLVLMSAVDSGSLPACARGT